MSTVIAFLYHILQIAYIMDIFHGKIRQFFKTHGQDNNFQFWVLQFVGWGGLCVFSFLSLTLWYNAVQLPYIMHTTLQSVLGIAVSVPLRYIYTSIWPRSAIANVSFALVAVLISSFIWTILRIYTYHMLVPEEDLWSDFGGWYFASFMVFAVWTAFYYAIKFFKQVQIEQLRAATAETKSREAQLKMLRYQLNPHFMFNTLNSVSALIKTNRQTQAQEMITELGAFLHYSLDTDPALKVSIRKELDTLQLYLNIEKVRYGDRLKLVFDIAQEAEQAIVPSLLLQPLYENALKYAIAGTVAGATVKLRVHAEEGMLRIQLSDTGPGLKKPMYVTSPIQKGIGLGLRNTYERLESQYGENYLFELSQTKPHGLKVSICIPLEYEEVEDGTSAVSHHVVSEI